MVDFTKILHQITSFTGHGHAGEDKGQLFRIKKTLVTPANRHSGIEAVYEEDEPEEIISAVLFPFVAKRWGMGVTDDFADLAMVTDVELTWDEDDDKGNDEIEYKGVRYRIVKTRHQDLLVYDDRWDYLLRRKHAQAGGL